MTYSETDTGISEVHTDEHKTQQDKRNCLRSVSKSIL
jgi:hypothetical protein